MGKRAIETMVQNRDKKDIDDIQLPAPEEYEPIANMADLNEMDSKVAYQLLEFLDARKVDYPNCNKLKRYIKLVKMLFNTAFPKIKHCGCFN